MRFDVNFAICDVAQHNLAYVCCESIAYLLAR